MKKVLSIVLALAMTMGLAACGNNNSKPNESANSTPSGSSGASSGTNNTAAPNEPVEVVCWSYLGDTLAGHLQKTIDAFNESQSKYHVSFVFQGSQAEVNAKLGSTSQADLPAMFTGAVENVAMYAAAEYCTPLQGYIDADTEGWPELESTWEAIRTAYCDNDGNQVGYPVGYSYPSIYYNADMLNEAGIDPKEIKSFDDLYDACSKLVKGGYTTYGIGFHPDGFYFNAALGREGLQAYNNNNGLGSERITECLYTKDTKVHDAIYNMLDVYQKLHAEKLCVPYGSDYQAEVIPQIASGDCAMMLGVVSMTTKVLDAVNGQFQVGIVPMVSATEAGRNTGEPAGGTGVYICNNGSEDQKQGAYEFIKFSSTGEYAAAFAVATGYLAPNQEAYTSDTYSDYVANTFPAIAGVYESLAASDDSATNPYIPISNEMKVANKLATETVSSDPSANIDDVIKTAEETIQEAIDLYNMSNP